MLPLPLKIGFNALSVYIINLYHTGVYVLLIKGIRVQNNTTYPVYSCFAKLSSERVLRVYFA